MIKTVAIALVCAASVVSMAQAQTSGSAGAGASVGAGPSGGGVSGSTGITAVDAYVRILNPNHLKQGPRIYSPDRAAPRTTTWQQA